MIAIDGETQLAARHEAANIEPKTKNEFVAIYLCHGRDKHWSRQAFHDLNILGVRPNTALSIGVDAFAALGGTMETAYAVYSALTDSNDAGLKAIRELAS